VPSESRDTAPVATLENVEGAYLVRPTGDRTRKRRALDEKLFLRFPRLARHLLLRWSRRPPESRIRRWLLPRIVAKVASAVNRRDFDVLLLVLDPEVDYRAVSFGPDGGIAPDLRDHMYGHEGYLQAWRTMLDAFDDVTLVPEEVLDLGDRLISTSRMSGHGSGSGVPVERRFFQVVWLRDGRIVREEDFGERSQALAAAGVSE
jgi:ketosteroid isomerase-like protein